MNIKDEIQNIQDIKNQQFFDDSIEIESKVIVVNNKAMRIKELTYKQMFSEAQYILGLAMDIMENGFNPQKDFEKVHAFCIRFGPLLSDWTGEEFLDLTPSQIKKIFNYIMEVNQDFLSIMESTGLKTVLLELKSWWKSSLTRVTEELTQKESELNPNLKKESDIEKNSTNETKESKEVELEFPMGNTKN